MLRRGLLTAIVLLLVLSALPPHAQASTTLDVSIPGEAQQLDGSGRPIMVAGIWHYINITFDVLPSSVTIELYWNSTEPPVKDVTNYYSWSYDGSTWSDSYPDMELIDPERCHVVGGQRMMAFVVGLSVEAPERLWWLHVGSERFDVIVEAPEAHPLVREEDLRFEAEVGVSESISSSEMDRDVLIRNLDGNVPIHASVEFADMAEHFHTVNLTDPIVRIGEERTVEIVLTTDPGWTSMYMGVDASVLLRYAHRLWGQGGYVLNQTWEVRLNITLVVGRAGYEAAELGSILFQYEDSYQMGQGETSALDVFITGYGTVQLSTVATDIEIESIELDGSATDQPLFLALSGEERHVRYTVRATTGGVTAYVHHQLEATGGTMSYITEVEVGPGAEPDDGEGLLWPALFIAACCVALGILMARRYMMSRGDRG